LKADPDIQEALDVACSECNSDLKKGQRYCSNCGIEIDWEVSPAHPTQINIEGTTSDARKRKYWVAFAVVVGIVVLLSLISSGANSKQEECFKHEMTKFGAFADPKGWAVTSRIYCQSLYP